MSEYYNPTRTRNLFDPKSKAAFRLSRSKIDLFLNCPRCFYLDRRIGIGRPPGFPFNLNSAVDALLKKEFDAHRAKGIAHPLMKAYAQEHPELKDAVPFVHDDLNIWRENFQGVQYHHKATNFTVTGAVDDIWVHQPTNELVVVDYKATSKEEKVSLDKEWQIGYKRQMEIYQWLLRRNGFDVSSTGYFVYCNGKTDRKAFDARLEFDIDLIAYTGNDSWVEQTLHDARECLSGEGMPPSSDECDYCAYRRASRDIETKV